MSRIKMLSQLKLDEHAANQDGRFSMQEKGMPVDVRVSIVPTGYGEGVVMRLLRRDAEAKTLEQLGFTQHNLELVEKALRRPYGLIVVTGPTGSGKSTTLYALLKRLNNREKKIITLEDPIEYRMEGVQQSQITPETGYTFAEGLKGVLRQDPDIVMVGEIRDPETATIALNASLTGHLVLTTMHTNDAMTAHTRFLELGVAPFLLSGSINLIVAQRLVRILQPGSTPENPQYKGRVVIAEVLEPNAELERAVQKNADMATLQEIAKRSGMVSMLDDGMEKVRAGITSQEEVSRVTTA
jgi:type IV pilus assembly protein PilB